MSLSHSQGVLAEMDLINWSWRPITLTPLYITAEDSSVDWGLKEGEFSPIFYRCYIKWQKISDVNIFGNLRRRKILTSEIFCHPKFLMSEFFCNTEKYSKIFLCLNFVFLCLKCVFSCLHVFIYKKLLYNKPTSRT